MLNRIGASALPSLFSSNNSQDKLPVDTIRRIINLIPTPICIFDDDEGNISISNSEFDILMKVSKQKTMMNILDSISSEEQEKLLSTLKSMRRFSMKLSKASGSLNTIVTKSNDTGFSFEWSLRFDQECNWIIAAVRSLYIDGVVKEKQVNKVKRITSITRIQQPSASSTVHIEDDSAFIHDIIDSNLSIRSHLSEEQWKSFTETVEMKTKNSLKSRDKKLEAHYEAESVEAKRLFFRVVSHEMRTPLSVALSGLNLLEDGSHYFTNETLGILRDIKLSCNMAVDILNDLLIYEKIEGKELEINKCECDVESLLVEVSEMFTVQAEILNIQLEKPLRASPFPIKANIDTEKVSQLFRNLISNALNFTPECGKVSTKIGLISDPLVRRKSFFRVEVCDTGRGLDVDSQNRLLQMSEETFSGGMQGEQGTGLGLFVSQRIAELHGGSIGVYSEGVGLGSTFFVELPVALDHKGGENCGDEEANTLPKKDDKAVFLPSLRSYRGAHVSKVPTGGRGEEGRERSRSRTSGSMAAGRKPRILIVDDVALCRKMHVRVIAPECLIVDEAVNGLDAVEKTIKSMSTGAPYDGILMDSSMPLMSGVLATKIIKDSGFKGTIYGVTGNCLPSDIEDFITNGASRVFIKPLTSEQVLFMLASFQSGEDY